MSATPKARPRRSVLYMPGANTRALEKARSLPADGLILDLEDATAPDAKISARENVIKAVADGGYGKREIFIRINALDTSWGQADALAVARSKADAILIPKVESASHVHQVEAILEQNGAPDSLRIWCMMETPRGILHAEQIAGASQRLAGFVLGTSDLAKDLHAAHTPLRLPMITSLGLTLLAARAYGLAILDGVYLNLEDDPGFGESCLQGKELGFDGKTLIHPKQVAKANEVFAPSEADVAWARKIIAAYAEAEAQGKGVVLVDGKLIENLHVVGARRQVELAEAIAELGERNMSSKTFSGNFFEDFRVGQVLKHATPRTITEGDVALYTALYGPRFALSSSDEFARSLGLPRAPVDDLLAFHMVFGKTVPDVSLNAVANLGYANGKFGVPLYPGDTVTTTSTVTGLKQNSNGKTGVVYVNSVGKNQHGHVLLDYARWVMVNKRDESKPAPEPVTPNLPSVVSPEQLHVPEQLHLENYDFTLSGDKFTWNDYAVGEKIDHVDGMTIEEAEHQLATRLYQNTAKVHFDQHAANLGRFKRRLIYGGHIISLARCLSFNGLANAFRVLAINAGSHANPSFAGDTIYAYSEVLEKIELPARKDVGALRVRLVATKNQPTAQFPLKKDGKYEDAVVLDLDYTLALPR